MALQLWCSLVLAQATTAPAQELVIYHDAENRFSISHPAEWVEKEAPGNRAKAGVTFARPHSIETIFVGVRQAPADFDDDGSIRLHGFRIRRRF
jgi:hypothetical protein